MEKSSEFRAESLELDGDHDQLVEAADHVREKKSGRLFSFVTLLSIFATIGGFVFGYDIG